mmetsp:Transcript_17383/g.52692  ORF Transcript_17383/g.52692 Transcript_17383/m.52692 type:complete len:694 (+) Transcript_17383:172-2253(+)
MVLAGCIGPVVVLVAWLPASKATSVIAHGKGTGALTPINKVVDLMKDMLAKGKHEKEEEENKFTAFSQWCSDQKRVKAEEIKEGQAKKEKLDAEILKAKASIRAHSDRISALEEDIGRWKKDEKSATSVRNKENVDYKAVITDYDESLDALTAAIGVLKSQNYDRPQADFVQTLLQVKHLTRIPASAKSALAAFLQQAQPSVEAMPDERVFASAPEANAYEFQSAGVIDMLVRLKDEFASKKGDLMNDELKAKHAYELIMQQLNDNGENAEHEILQKKSWLSDAQQIKAALEGDLAQTTTDHDEDNKYLRETNALCQQKATDFQSRQQLRAGEIATLEKALEIVSSKAVAGAGETYQPTLLQFRRKPGTSLAQVLGGQRSPLQARIAAFLAERARLSSSRLLSEVSQHVAQDPFQKVKKMIKGLISQLMEESTAETEHKGWCDTELTTNKQTRDRKTADINSLTAQVEDLTASIAQLTQDLADLATGVKELEDAMASATLDRTASKEENEQTIKDAQGAQTAVEQAMAIVKDFYEKSAQATVLTQQTPAADAPETFDKPYSGMLPQGSNIVDFLEVILSDFARLESEITSSESAEQDRYEQFMFESRKDKALKENESKHKSAKRTDNESALHSAEVELKSTQEQLSAAVAYYEKLKPTCVDAGISYEERVKRREDEMQTLQEALKILSGEDVA